MTIEITIKRDGEVIRNHSIPENKLENKLKEKMYRVEICGKHKNAVHVPLDDYWELLSYKESDPITLRWVKFGAEMPTAEGRYVGLTKEDELIIATSLVDILYIYAHYHLTRWLLLPPIPGDE